MSKNLEVQTIEMKIAEIVWLKPGDIWNGNYRIQSTSALDKKIGTGEIAQISNVFIVSLIFIFGMENIKINSL